MERTNKERKLDSFDVFHPTLTWPLYFRKLFNSDHIDRKQRFELWLFFWRNGLPPARATYNVLWQRPAIVKSSQVYDQNARNSLRDLEKKALAGHWDYLNKFPMINLSEGRVSYRKNDGTWV